MKINNIQQTGEDEITLKFCCSNTEPNHVSLLMLRVLAIAARQEFEVSEMTDEQCEQEIFRNGGFVVDCIANRLLKS